MKKNIIMAVFCLILSAISFAQVPQKMSYQAVVRGSDNNLVTNQQVAMRVSILQGSADGTAVYTETHSATTNANGLVSIEIGDGTSNDDFTAINWANGPFFVKTETDVNGGDDYDIVGVSQLLSVPYAMYAQTAGNMPDVSVFLTEEADPTIPDWAKAATKPQYDYSEIQNTPEIPERQVISISNDTIFLSDGGFVKLPPAAVGFSGDYNDLTNRPAIPTVPTNVSAFTNDANYLTSYTETDPTVPSWAKTETKPTYSYDEITGKPELFSGNYNDLTNKPTIPTVPTLVSAFENDANYLQSESDPTVPTWAKAETKPSYSYEEITGKPELFSGNYNDLTNKPTIPTVPTNVSAFTNDANYVINETDPTVPDWAKANAKPTYSYDEITGKPELFSGNYNDLTNKPTIPTVPTNVSAFENDANYLQSESDPTVPTWAKAETKPTYSYDEITGKPELFSGNYNDLTNKPTIPTVPTNVSAFTNDANYVVNETDPTIPDWAKANAKPTYSYDEITGKPELFSGNYNDLTNKPAIPTVPTNVSAFTNDANYVINESDPTVPTWAKTETKPSYSYEEITGKPELFSGNYNDLTNKPTIPTVPTSVSAFENDANYISAESQTLADVAALGNSLNTQLKNVTDPTDAQDAATKKYVDDLIAALQAQNEALQETLSAVICNITFDANGGTGTMNPQTMVKGAAQAITTNTFTKENYTFAGWNTAADGSGTSYTDGQSITIPGNMTLYAQWRELRGILNGYEWVDLGLPSGLLWATCNVGAASPEEYGNYYAWGETSTKTTYTEDNYTYSGNPTTLPSSADAASANWGEGWRMPTQTEMQELIDNCNVTWKTQNEVNGRLFTGPNGNSIFLPAAGYRDGSSLYGVGSYGYYWSSSLDSFLYFTSGFYHMRNGYRDWGLSVRPVCVQ